MVRTMTSFKAFIVGYSPNYAKMFTEEGWYVVSDGTTYPYRCKIRTGSFSAMSIIDKISRGLMLADLVTLIASIDVVAPEVDR